MIPEGFHFLRPAWLAALLLLVPLAGWARRRRSDAGAWRGVCDPHLLPHLLVPGRARAALAPFALFALGWLGAALAVAGPTWQRLPQPAFQNPDRTVFVLSLAPSMDRDDVAPSRLARARHKLGDAIDRLDGSAVGLVVFREEAYGAVPLTDDADVLREVLPRIRTDLAPGREALPSRGLAEARRMLEAVGTAGARVLLLSDGSDADPRATRDAALGLARDGARVSVLALVPSAASDLASVADAGGGVMAKLSADDADLDRLLAPEAGAGIGTRLARSEVQTDAWRDVGAWLVWIPLALASLAFRKGWVTAVLALACVGLPSAPAQAGVADWFQRPDQRGAHEFAAGRYGDSAEAFESPAWRAAAHYRAGAFDRAAEELRALDDPRSQYNLGNALARAGRLDQALAAYDRSLAAAPDDPDARFNPDLVQRLLDSRRERKSDAGDSGGKGDGKSGSASQAKPGGDGAPQRDAAGTDPGTGAAAPREPDADGASAARDRDTGGNPEGGGSEEGSAPPPDRGADAKPGDGAGAAGPEPQQAGSASPTERSEELSRGDGGASPRGDAAGEADAGGAPADAKGSSSAREARDPWLAHLPDDPGGLLREKLRRDYLRKREARLRGELP